MELKAVKSVSTSGFTLIEVMIVVMILGLLSSLALPEFNQIRESTQNSRLANDMRVFGGAILTFAIAEGEYPEDSSSGAVPSGLEKYINVGTWNQGTPIGGVWDVELDSFGVISAVGVHRFTIGLDQLTQFDEQYDDGDLGSGRYRRLTGDRYYYVVAE